MEWNLKLCMDVYTKLLQWLTWLRVLVCVVITRSFNSTMFQFITLLLKQNYIEKQHTHKIHTFSPASGYQAGVPHHLLPLGQWSKLACWALRGSYPAWGWVGVILRDAPVRVNQVDEWFDLHSSTSLCSPSLPLLPLVTVSVWSLALLYIFLCDSGSALSFFSPHFGLCLLFLHLCLLQFYILVLSCKWLSVRTECENMK